MRSTLCTFLHIVPNIFPIGTIIFWIISLSTSLAGFLSLTFEDPGRESTVCQPCKQYFQREQRIQPTPPRGSSDRSASNKHHYNFASLHATLGTVKSLNRYHSLYFSTCPCWFLPEILKSPAEQFVNSKYSTSSIIAFSTSPPSRL